MTPVRGKHDPSLPPCGLLLVNPDDAAYAVRRSVKENWIRHFLFHSNLFVVPEKGFFWAGPGVGAPMAVLCLEKLIALGARQIIVVGWCGALSSDLEVGDIVLPTSAVSEEGTSAHYPVSGDIYSSGRLRNLLRGGISSGWMKIHEGEVWTTDAPYRETREKVALYQGQGVLGVEMEYSALLQVAAFRKVQLAAVLLVSDLLWQDPWVPAFHGKTFRKRSRQLLDDLFGYFESSASFIAG